MSVSNSGSGISSSDSGIGRNSVEFPLTPSHSGSGIGSRNRLHIAKVRVRMGMNVSEQLRIRNQFKRFRNWTEFQGIPTNSVLFRIRNQIAESVAYNKCEGEDGTECQ